MWPAIGREVIIGHSLIQGQLSASPGPRFIGHRWVFTESANEGIALETCTTAVKLSRKCPYSSVQGTGT